MGSSLGERRERGCLLVLTVPAKFFIQKKPRARGEGNFASYRSRYLAAALVSMLALCLVLATCAGPGQEEDSAGPTVGEFVGEIPQANAYVAVVAPEPQEEGSEREIRAYLCDGQSTFEWFVGEASSDELRLTSEGGGAQLDVSLGTEAADGTVLFADGRSLVFEMPPATGIDGYYPVVIMEDGHVSGSSWSGADLEGHASGGKVMGTITPSEGAPDNLDITAPNIEAGEWRWIFYDGGLRGGNKSGRAGIIDRETDI